MKKKANEVNVQSLSDEGKFDINDFVLYIAREEAARGNGWLAKGLAVPGAILLPGVSQVALVERYVKIAKPYFKTRNIEISDKDLRRFLTRNCTTVMVMIWENPKKFLEEYPKLIGAKVENEEKEES